MERSGEPSGSAPSGDPSEPTHDCEVFPTYRPSITTGAPLPLNIAGNMSNGMGFADQQMMRPATMVRCPPNFPVLRHAEKLGRARRLVGVEGCNLLGSCVVSIVAEEACCSVQEEYGTKLFAWTFCTCRVCSTNWIRCRDARMCYNRDG
jgi:hypothetical protein